MSLRIPTFDRMSFPSKIEEVLFANKIIVDDPFAPMEYQARMWLRCLAVSEAHEEHWRRYDTMPESVSEGIWQWRNKKFFERFPQCERKYEEDGRVFVAQEIAGIDYDAVVEEEQENVLLGLARVMSHIDLIKAIHWEEINERYDDEMEKYDRAVDRDDADNLIKPDENLIAEEFVAQFRFYSPFDRWYKLVEEEKELEEEQKKSVLLKMKTAISSSIPEHKMIKRNVPIRGYVYVMVSASSREIKIGYSKDVHGRAKDLSKGVAHSWQPVCSEEFADAETAEYLIHRQFEDFREKKEFFRLKPDKATKAVFELRKKIDNNQVFRYLQEHEHKSEKQIQWYDDPDDSFTETLFSLFNRVAKTSLHDAKAKGNLEKGIDAVVVYQEHFISELSLSKMYEVFLLRTLKEEAQAQRSLSM